MGLERPARGAEGARGDIVGAIVSPDEGAPGGKSDRVLKRGRMVRTAAVVVGAVNDEIADLRARIVEAGWNPFVIDASTVNEQSFAKALDECGALVAHFVDNGDINLKPFVQRAATLGIPAVTNVSHYDNVVGDLEPPDTDKRITAVISTYNKPTLLRRALESFTKQTLPAERFEVIVVDDCSTVDPRSVIAEFEDKLPLVYIRHDENKGLGETRNTAIARATGDFVAFFDDDNIVGPRLLAEHLRTHLEHPRENFAALAFTGIHSSVEITNVLWSVTQTLQTYVSYGWMNHGDQLPWHCAWGGCSSFKTSLLRRYPYEVKWMEDMDLAWRLRRENLTVVHNRHAVQYIGETETVESWTKRARRQGRAAALLASRHTDPEFLAYLGAPTAKADLAALEPRVEHAKYVIEELDALPRTQIAQYEALDNAYRTLFDYERLNALVQEAVELGIEKPRAAGKKILVIDVLFPMADRASGANRLRQLLGMMVDAGHQVTFFAMNGSNQESYEHELRSLGIDTVSGDPFRLAAAYKMQSNHPPFDIGRLLSERNFDIAFIEFFYVAEQYIPEIRRWSPDTRIIVDTVDIHYVRERRQAAIAGDTAMAQESEVTRRREQATYAQADEVVAVTEADRNALLQLVPGSKTSVLPNVHDSSPVNTPFGKREGLLFVGNFIHPPNADAITWFASVIWPQVQRAIPNIELTVVGANAPESLNGVRGIKPVGYVPSMKPFLDMARFSIAPLRSGSGMKGKVGEALGAGLPVIATSVASEGMHLTSGENVIVANEADEFAQAIIRAYSDKALWTKLSANGRHHVDAMYGTETVRKMLDQLISGEVQVFVTVPDWNNISDLRNTLAEYTNNFGPGDAVSLVIGVQNHDVDSATGTVVSVLGELGLDPANIADVEITPWDDSSASALPSNAIWLNKVS